MYCPSVLSFIFSISHFTFKGRCYPAKCFTSSCFIGKMTYQPECTDHPVSV